MLRRERGVHGHGVHGAARVVAGGTRAHDGAPLPAGGPRPLAWHRLSGRARLPREPPAAWPGPGERSPGYRLTTFPAPSAIARLNTSCAATRSSTVCPMDLYTVNSPGDCR